jgi:hypothetical protein
MLNEKKAGMPVSKQRELPRIVAGTDLMAALRQSIERAKEAQPKPTVAIKPAPPAQPVTAAKPAAASKGKKAANRNLDQREMLLPIAGGAPAKAAAEKQPAKPGATKKAG